MNEILDEIDRLAKMMSDSDAIVTYDAIVRLIEQARALYAAAREGDAA